MSNPNFRGRQKGSTKNTSIISDPLLGDYKVIFDEESYNLIFTEPETKKEKVIGYYTSLPNLLRRVAKNQVVKEKSTYSLKEYVNSLETTLNKFNTLINHE
jgi:hypothetical protein